MSYFCPICGAKYEELSIVCPRCYHPFNRKEVWKEWPKGECRYSPEHNNQMDKRKTEVEDEEN